MEYGTIAVFHKVSLNPTPTPSKEGEAREFWKGSFHRYRQGYDPPRRWQQ